MEINRKLYFTICVIALILAISWSFLFFTALSIGFLFAGFQVFDIKMLLFIAFVGLSYIIPIISIVILTKSPSTNNKITLTGKYTLCLILNLTIILIISIWLFDIFILRKIEQTEKRENYIESISNKAIQECLKQKSSANECVANVAFQENNISLCKYINIGKESNECVDNIIENNDISICQTIISKFENYSDFNIERCYTYFALKENNAEICSNLLKYEDKITVYARCITEVAIQSKNSSICSLNGPEKTKRDCLISLAEALQDNSICYQLSDEYYIPSCLRAANRTNVQE